MVDIVVNNVPALSVQTSQSTQALQSDGSYLTNPNQFHSQCWIDYNNQTSVENCWLGDNNLPLMDVNTEDQGVVGLLQKWIQNFVSTYNIDGLRIDGGLRNRFS